MSLDAALSALTGPPDAAERDLLDRLHTRLEQAAADRELLDVAWTRVDSPVGPLLLAATPAGVVRVAFEREDHDLVLEQLGRAVSPRVLRAPARLDDVVRELAEYFAGTRRDFDVAIDLRLATGFRREVLERLRDIGYGSTASYTAVATAAGRPRAVRAVGTACATNPVPLVVPCHRVVRSDGTTGGYRGGPQAKQVLLRIEGAA